jgi:hypothetical protein
MLALLTYRSEIIDASHRLKANNSSKHQDLNGDSKMKVNLTHGAIDLARGKLVSLDAAAGWALSVSHGSIWLTSPEMPGDFILHRGQSIRLTGNAHVVAEAMRDSCIRLEPAHQPKAHAAADKRAARAQFNAVAA